MCALIYFKTARIYIYSSGAQTDHLVGTTTV